MTQNYMFLLYFVSIFSSKDFDYDISNRKVASILDTFSCITQGFLPYGAQILVALSVVSTLGYELTAFQIISHLFYPMMLLASSLVFIFLIPEKKKVNAK